MTGLAFRRSVLRALDLALLVVLIHIVGIAVVGGDDKDAARLFHRVVDALKADVERPHRDLNRLIDAGVTDHVAVGIVEADEIVSAAFNGFDDGVGDLGALHPRALFKRNDVGGDLKILLAVETAGTMLWYDMCVCDIGYLNATEIMEKQTKLAFEELSAEFCGSFFQTNTDKSFTLQYDEYCKVNLLSKKFFDKHS